MAAAAAAVPRRERPRLTHVEAVAEVCSHLSLGSTDCLVADVPGGIYGGYEIIDRVLRDALLPGGLWDSRCSELGASCVECVRIKNRCLTDHPPAPVPRLAAPYFLGPTLDSVCRWLAHPNRGPPFKELDFSETWINDNDLETLRHVLGIGRYSVVLPENIVLTQNCITLLGAVEFVRVLAELLQQTPPGESRRCILDIRYNWISDIDEFREAVAGYHRPELGMFLQVCENDNEIPPARAPAEPVSLGIAHLFVLVGPSWNMGEGRIHLNNTWKSNKLPWNLYMAGPASKLACVLEYEGHWTKWSCPLCAMWKSKYINEEGGRVHCPSVTFGGILISHLRGDEHRKAVYGMMQASGMDRRLVEEFDVAGSPYFFNWLSGSQGTSRNFAEIDEVIRMIEDSPPPPPLCPPPSAQPPAPSRANSLFCRGDKVIAKFSGFWFPAQFQRMNDADDDSADVLWDAVSSVSKVPLADIVPLQPCLKTEELEVEQHVLGWFFTKWESGTVWKICGDAQVEVVWDTEYSMSILPISDIVPLRKSLRMIEDSRSSSYVPASSSTGLAPPPPPSCPPPSAQPLAPSSTGLTPPPPPSCPPPSAQPPASSSMALAPPPPPSCPPPSAQPPASRTGKVETVERSANLEDLGDPWVANDPWSAALEKGKGITSQTAAVEQPPSLALKKTGKDRQRALDEGVLEAKEGKNGLWYVQLEPNVMRECSGDYFCRHCEKHLHDSTLSAHLDSDAHKRKLYWYALQSASTPSSLPAAVAPRAAPSTSWCAPCSYEAPALEYLAYVTDPNGQRMLRCLMCQKWVNDDWSHIGTHENPSGSKEHQKNLRLYGPGSPWWEEEVVKVRQRWHPLHQKQASNTTTRQPDKIDLPVGWTAHEDDGRIFYFHAASRTSTWEVPVGQLEEALASDYASHASVDGSIQESKAQGTSHSNDTNSSVWKRYQMEDGENYWWWCELDNDCFLEANPGPWTRYVDPDTERHYWWKSEDKWFWITTKDG